MYKLDTNISKVRIHTSKLKIIHTRNSTSHENKTTSEYELWSEAANGRLWMKKTRRAVFGKSISLLRLRTKHNTVTFIRRERCTEVSTSDLQSNKFTHERLCERRHTIATLWRLIHVQKTPDTHLCLFIRNDTFLPLRFFVSFFFSTKIRQSSCLYISVKFSGNCCFVQL